MQSKNKKAPKIQEKDHIRRIKEMACVICSQPGPSECHEIKQGQWFTSLPLCADCHRGSLNGIHGQKRMWNIYKLEELDALAMVIERLLSTVDS